MPEPPFKANGSERLILKTARQVFKLPAIDLQGARLPCGDVPHRSRSRYKIRPMTGSPVNKGFRVWQNVQIKMRP